MIIDQDAIVACADLAGRTGAKNFQIGYLYDDVPMNQAGWYAHAHFKGARIMAEGNSPWEACDNLARRLLSGAKCTGCDQTVSLSDITSGCRWKRMGSRWEKGCD